jgi:hypothetical protein
MAWTAPRDWTAISGGIVTAASLNTDVRDNLGVLSTHTHTGAAGFGASSMTGLTLAALVTLTFADQSANPDAAGELQRNGNDLLFYGSSAVNLTTADASAGTASLRSLGTTSVKAAAGNHTHTISAVGNSEAAGTANIGDDSGVDVTIATVSRSAATSTNAIVVIGAYDSALSNGNVLYKIFQATTALASETLTGAGGTGRAIHTQIAVFLPASTSSIAYKLTMSPANVAANNQSNFGTIRVLEITI